MGLRGYILGRVIQIFPVVVLIVCLNFVIIVSAPGDPVLAMIGEGAMVSREWIERAYIKYGLNRPIPERMWLYITRVLQGDLGDSYTWNKPVSHILMERLGNTLLLTITAQAIAIPLGIIIGALAARTFLSKKDTAVTIGAWIIYSMPIFWMALILMYTFGVYLGWLPISGMVTIGGEGGGSIVDVLRHMILPVTPLILWNFILYFRICRASVVEVLSEDYITTANAKGLSKNRVFYGHAVRNALLPTVTMAGISMGHIVSGALLTETVFAWPGIGELTVASISKRDYPVLMGIFLITSITVLIFSLITDLIYAYLDPRIKYK